MHAHFVYYIYIEETQAIRLNSEKIFSVELIRNKKKIEVYLIESCFFFNI
jgi:hypothetical protein